jgi:hypothetical protein
MVPEENEGEREELGEMMENKKERVEGGGRRGFIYPNCLHPREERRGEGRKEALRTLSVITQSCGSRSDGTKTLSSIPFPLKEMKRKKRDKTREREREMVMVQKLYPVFPFC